jgi:hypothetical protein
MRHLEQPLSLAAHRIAVLQKVMLAVEESVMELRYGARKDTLAHLERLWRSRTAPSPETLNLIEGARFPGRER